MLNINYIIVPIIAYLLGSFPTALFFIEFFFKKDPRGTGSKNIGALNTLRIASKEKGKLVGILSFLFVFLIDAGKAVLAVWLAMQFLPDSLILAITLATFFAVLGHNYSILLGFDGGRGAASLIGVILFLDWKMFLVWLGTVLIFILLFDLIDKKKIGKGFVKDAINKQVLGRLAGEVFALIPIFFLNITVFYPILAATPLILIRHKDRLKEQLCKK